MNTSRTQKTSSDVKSRVFLIDDHQVMREGLRRMLEEESDLVVCGEAENAKAALGALEKNLPDLAIIDISMPGASGLELIKDLKSRFPELKIVVLSMHDESLYAERVLRAGARGYVMKQVSVSQLLTAIRTVLRQEIYMSPSFSTRVLQSFAGQKKKAVGTFDQLSDREIEVLRLIGDGYMTREIATSLGISAKTVESHRGNIRLKLKLKNGAELVRFAIAQRGDVVSKPQPIA